MGTKGKSLSVNLTKSKIVLILSCIAGSFFLLSITGQILLRSIPSYHIQGIINFFDLSAEGNLPTLYTSLLLLFSALLLFIRSIKAKSDNSPDLPHWILLSFGFLYLSLDEMLKLHEGFSILVRELTDYSGHGVLKSPWVIAGTIVVVLLLLVFLKFIIRLKPKIRFIFLLTGFLYIGGAIGFEILENIHAENYGQNLVYSMMQNIEECMEMAGVIVFIYGLLSTLSCDLRTICLNFERLEE